MILRRLGPASILLLLSTAAAGMDQQSIVQQLLDQPAPAPDWRATTQPVREGAIPADDAPIAVLVAFWSSEDVMYARQAPTPSDKVRLRLLDAALQQPERIQRLLHWLPETPDVCRRVNDLYEKLPDATEPDKELRQIVHDWLMIRGPYFHEDLMRAADGAQEEAMAALARLDWPAAQPVLNKHCQHLQAQVRIQAMIILYEHHVQAADKAATTEFRGRLRAIVTDAKSPASSRDAALQALMRSPWDGRDDWFLSLFSDRSLMGCEEGHTIYMPLREPVVREPDHWIPILSRMVGAKDKAVHDNTVSCLVQFQLDMARQDAIKPLLPWLSNPDWSAAGDRLRLVQSLDRVELPESVPGLLWVLRNSSGFEQAGAAEALGHYCAKEAGPALREAFEKEHDAIHSKSLVKAMLRCDALTDQKIVSAIEAYARDQVADPDREHPLLGNGPRQSVPVELGQGLSYLAVDRDAAAEKLLTRAQEIRAKEPKIADTLSQILTEWPAPAVDRDLVRRLRVQPDVTDIRSSLARQPHMLKNVKQELQQMTREGGALAGFAAAILADTDVCQRLLAGDDLVARQMLLACARLVRTPLPVADAGRLLDKGDVLLTLAAERYLESEDSAAARKLVLARHPAEALILGARMGFDPGHITFGAFDNIENHLRKEVLRQDGPEEVVALLSEGYWGSAGQRIIRVTGTKATLVVERGNGKRLLRELAGTELAQLRQLLATHAVDDLPPLNTIVFDGMQYEYVHLTRAGGRRVFMNNPGTGTAGTAYDLLTQGFLKLASEGKFEVRHALQDAIAGARLVLSEENHPVQAVWKNGQDMRVFVDATSKRPDAVASWHAIKQDRVAEAVGQPDACPILGEEDDIPESAPELRNGLNHPRWQVMAGQYAIRAGVDYYQGARIGGLWRCRKGQQPAKICDNAFARPVVTPDGKWAVASRSDAGWAEIRPLIRVDLASGEQLPTDIAPARFSEAVMYSAAHGKMLVSFSNGKELKDGTPVIEYRLLDPATGKSEPMTGQFEPLAYTNYRPLQPTSNPDEAWAAIPDREQAQTQIGRYDLKRFAFKPVLTLPEVRFTSMAMWVDEPESAAYITIGGDLLRIPLPPDPVAR